jgi:hypothetical protein
MGGGDGESANREMAAEDGAERRLRRRIEGVERLVEQPERRARGQHAGKRGAAALAGRQGPHGAPGDGGEIEGGERGGNAVARRLGDAAGRVEILAHREIALQAVEMAEPGDAAAPGLAVAGRRRLPASG